MPRWVIDSNPAPAPFLLTHTLPAPPLLQERDSAAADTGVRLMERSVFSDRMVFVRTVQESGWMGDVELAVYDSWFEPILNSQPSLLPDGFIYLRADPNVCMDRWVTCRHEVRLTYHAYVHKVSGYVRAHYRQVSAV
jgi:deoxyadenosine/deoxycytidine kinase